MAGWLLDGPMSQLEIGGLIAGGLTAGMEPLDPGVDPGMRLLDC